MTRSETKKLRGVRPRTLVAVMALVLVIAAIVMIVWLLKPQEGVELVGFSRESTATVSYAGAFPAEGEQVLLNPLGITVRGTTIYVAESDAGRIRVFGLNGQDAGSIALPVADGAPTAYPSDIATLGADRLVVVDNSGSRVVIMDTERRSGQGAVTVLGESDPKTAPIQPTAVAVDRETIYVADGTGANIKAYSSDGVYQRTVVQSVGGSTILAGGLIVSDGKLYATDSNAGRVSIFDARDGSTKGLFPDAFALPRGLGSGLAGGLLVVDTFERTIRLTDRVGKRIDAIDGNVSGDGSLGSPRGVVWVPSSSRAYVTDAASGRVVIFNMRRSTENGLRYPE